MKINLSTTKEIFNTFTQKSNESTKYHILDEKELVATQEQWLNACLSLINPFCNFEEPKETKMKDKSEVNDTPHITSPQPLIRTKRFSIPKDQCKRPQDVTSYLINFMKQQEEINKTNNNFNK